MGKALKDIGIKEVPAVVLSQLEMERARWNGDPYDLHSFLDSLTEDQVRRMQILLGR
jgi:hypothetical protein